jgi:hypothetical protein
MPKTDNTLESLLRWATDLEATLRRVTDDQYAADAADRLRDSVIRPLRDVTPLPAGQTTSTPDGAPGNWAEEPDVCDHAPPPSFGHSRSAFSPRKAR